MRPLLRSCTWGVAISMGMFLGNVLAFIFTDDVVHLTIAVINLGSALLFAIPLVAEGLEERREDR